MKLTDTERLILANQYEILGRVEHSQIVSVSAMVEGSTRPSD
jgi:uncharacterized protein YfbU (UPF0304 family)